ncbi:MAR-binding filament-like protein 1-1 [Punica granatum]|uniref:FRIGIDA-like protein n=1 Tax=Punica granatum TaxID=22663 RepID=A0A6P8BY80_PUNGR|nr:MAR-binding filament-like protein 1-1 [Punica granatum]
MGTLSDDLGLALCKEESLRRTLDLVEAQANAVLLFGRRWRDLEEHLDSISKATDERLEQLGVKGSSVEERFAEVVSEEREVEKKAKDFKGEVVMRLSLLERMLEECWKECRENEDCLASVVTESVAEPECLGETEVKEKELISVSESVEDCRRESEMKKQELDDLQRRIEAALNEHNSREENLNSVQKLLEECSMGLEEKTLRLQSTEDSLKERSRELEFKIDELEWIQTAINDVCKHLDSKNDQLTSIKQSIRASDRAIQKKNQELLSLQDSLKTCCTELDSKKMELDEIQKLLAECTRELDLKERQLSSTKTLIDEFNEELTSKKKDYDAIQKSIIACSTEVDSKRSELASLEKSVNDLKMDGQKEVKVESLQKCSQQYSSVISLKKAELASLHDTIKKVGGDLDLKERRHQVLCTSIKSLNTELEMKKELESAKTVEREGDLKSSEEQLQFSQKELASARAERDECPRKLHSAQASFEGCSRILQGKDRQLQEQLMELKSQQERLNMMQKLLEEKRAEDELRKGDNILVVQQKLLEKIEKSLDPAKLVLQAMQEVYSPSSRKNVKRFNSGVTKRSCVLLLRYLGEASPEIKPQVKEGAMALANQWKAQLSASSDDDYTFRVLALLRLIVVFELTPAFCPNELGVLSGSIFEHGETNELRMLLGLSEPLPCPKVILLRQAEEKLALISPVISGHSLLQHRNKRSRMA